MKSPKASSRYESCFLKVIIVSSMDMIQKYVRGTQKGGWQSHISLKKQGSSKWKQTQTYADKRWQMRANAEAKTQANACKREQTLTNASKRLHPLCIWVSYTPLAIPLTQGSSSPSRSFRVDKEPMKPFLAPKRGPNRLEARDSLPFCTWAHHGITTTIAHNCKSQTNYRKLPRHYYNKKVAAYFQEQSLTRTPKVAAYKFSVSTNFRHEP